MLVSPTGASTMNKPSSDVLDSVSFPDTDNRWRLPGDGDLTGWVADDLRRIPGTVFCSARESRLSLDRKARSDFVLGRGGSIGRVSLSADLSAGLGSGCFEGTGFLFVRLAKAETVGTAQPVLRFCPTGRGRGVPGGGKGWPLPIGLVEDPSAPLRSERCGRGSATGVASSVCPWLLSMEEDKDDVLEGDASSPEGSVVDRSAPCREANHFLAAAVAVPIDLFRVCLLSTDPNVLRGNEREELCRGFSDTGLVVVSDLSGG